MRGERRLSGSPHALCGVGGGQGEERGRGEGRPPRAALVLALTSSPAAGRAPDSALPPKRLRRGPEVHRSLASRAFRICLLGLV